MTFTDLLASCYLSAHGVFLCFFTLVVSTTQFTVKALVWAVLASSGFLFKTCRQVFIKEVFKWYYDHRFSISKFDTLRYCHICTIYQFSLFPIIFFLDKLVIQCFISIPDFNQFSKGNTIFCILFITEFLALEFIAYRFILKIHFEANINKYALLYWHCWQIFNKHTVPKNLCIPKVKCIWKKLSINKIPLVYFECIYREFILLALSPIGIIYALCQVEGKKRFDRYVTEAVHYVANIFKRIYNNFSDYKTVLDVSIFILSVAIFALYLRKVLQWIISDNNKQPTSNEQDKENKRFAKRMFSVYIKTTLKPNKRITYCYALKWSLCMVSGIWLLPLLNKFISDSNVAIFVITLYSIVYMTALYFALNHYVTEYSNIYVKAFTYNGKQYEFYRSTKDWSL